MWLLGKSHCERAPDRFQIWKFSDLANGLFWSPQSAFMAAAMPAIAATIVASYSD
jgi:hypothetical protein